MEAESDRVVGVRRIQVSGELSGCEFQGIWAVRVSSAAGHVERCSKANDDSPPMERKTPRRYAAAVR
jgi:hypothetical protein